MARKRSLREMLARRTTESSRRRLFERYAARRTTASSRARFEKRYAPKATVLTPAGNAPPQAFGKVARPTRTRSGYQPSQIVNPSAPIRRPPEHLRRSPRAKPGSKKRYF